MWRAHLVLFAALLASGCGTPAPDNRQYPLTGEVVAIKLDRTEVTVRHDEVKGFMAAMTMPFPIKDPSMLSDLAVGDTIAATLVITDEESYLTDVKKTGTVPPDKRGTIHAPPR